MIHRRQRIRHDLAATTLGLLMSGVTPVLAAATAPPKLHLHVAGGMPAPNRQPTQWRVVVLARNRGSAPARLTPTIRTTGVRVVTLQPSSARIDAGGSAAFFVLLETTGQATTHTITFGVKELPELARPYRLELGVDLSQLEWQSSWSGKGSCLADVKAPPTAGTWTPVRLPRLWQELGVTWVRTRFALPAAWQGKPLRLRLRAVDDADATFLNGREIGRTHGWDRQRTYEIPSEAVRWGQDNELAIAVDNPNAGGGVYRAPLLLTVGDAPDAGWPFAPAALQPESKRTPPGPIAPRLPMRRMVVRDGVLRYVDGGEVALWGVNTYPQSWTQFKSLEKLGIDPRRATDEDFEDFVQMGIDLIRIHVFDTEISDGQGNLVRNAHLDVLDYLVSKCNAAGIYLMLTPIAWWGSPSQRPDSFSRNTPKQAMSMWPERWGVQTSYLRQFLTHENPYTKRRLMDEPCLVLLEIINEPTYWSYGEVMGNTPGLTHLGPAVSMRGMGGVRRAWQQFAPSSDWHQPSIYACFRYETLRRYIDAMIDAIRDAGAEQPIAYSIFACSDVDIAQAIADSRCDAITMGMYPGGLRTINDDRNLLGELGNGALDARFADKARLAYEFDAAGMVTQACMYPAMARRWRNRGVQAACQFQYDARVLAHLNWDWPTHYLNLWHTPGKIVSFLIGGEAFRRLPRGATFATPDDDQVFGPAAASFRHNASLLAASDVYMQTGPTDWRPLPPPRNPKRILSVGTCPFFDYDGSGVVDLRIGDDRADLRIYPDVERLRGRELRGTLEKPLTRLHERSHPFRLRLSGWGETRVERRVGGGWKRIAGSAAQFTAAPGVYRLVRE